MPTEDRELEKQRELAVYVHWPFCESKCPYCDFNSHVRDHVDTAAYGRAYLGELQNFKALSGAASCSSIFFGGGTPSLMPPALVAGIIEAVWNLWPSAPEAEVTLEANPSSVEAGRFRAYRQAGVNRLSLGVQSLEDQALKRLGRLHDAAGARKAMTTALDIFERVNFDLIYARPGPDGPEPPGDWRRELGEVLSFGAGHLSLYQLTIEPGTAFHTAFRKGELPMPGEDASLALFDLTRELTEKAGLVAYEVSNHARDGEPCRHNLEIWRGGAYIGVGPGAHGRFQMAGSDLWSASQQPRTPENWLRAATGDDGSATIIEELEPLDRARELLLMGLRLEGGVERKGFQAKSGMALEDALSAEGLAAALEGGLIIDDEDHLKVSPRGLRVLDGLLLEIIR